MPSSLISWSEALISSSAIDCPVYLHCILILYAVMWSEEFRDSLPSYSPIPRKQVAKPDCTYLILVLWSPTLSQQLQGVKITVQSGFETQGLSSDVLNAHPLFPFSVMRHSRMAVTVTSAKSTREESSFGRRGSRAARPSTNTNVWLRG